MRETVHVPLGARAYDVLIGPGLLAEAGALIAPMLPRPRVAVVTETRVGALHLDSLRAGLAAEGIEAVALELPPGEATKSWAHLGQVTEWLLDEKIERRDVVIALGGGVIGDLTGLAAALMKRGMKFIQIPTTLLAQVDSSVGGKTAINTEHGKNLVGAFYQPALVLSDTDVLATLPEREKRAGFAEIIKYGLIDDAPFFDILEQSSADVLALKSAAITDTIARSCQSKARIVALDEREGGVRALLNLGHTFGHTLEAANGFGPDLLHGEAVGTGMALAMRYSARLGLMSAQEATRVDAALQAAGLTTRIENLDGGPYRAEHLVELMKHDKKARAGRVPLILARGIGEAFIHPEADLGDILAFLKDETTSS